jgi:hypothetical protein
MDAKHESHESAGTLCRVQDIIYNLGSIIYRELSRTKQKCHFFL